MQDIAALDAEDAQLSGNGYWVVKRTVISFAAPVRVHARLELKTYGIGFTCITAQRGYEARVAGEQHDEPIISARTLWVYVDPFPSAGQEFTRLQQITREGRVVVRACSRWLWRA